MDLSDVTIGIIDRHVYDSVYTSNIVIIYNILYTIIVR